MSALDAEVVIVGGGPAGAALGRRLARRGRDVLVIEAARFPRDKPCGDCLNPGALAELRALELYEPLLRRLRPLEILGWRVEAPDGRALRMEFGTSGGARLTGWAVRRRDLDAALMGEAARAGTRIRTGARAFDLLTERGRVVGVVWREGTQVRESRARLVVGADGIRSVVQRRLSLAAGRPRIRKLALVSHLQDRRGGEGIGELRVRRERVCGYAPLSDGANLTLVVSAAEAGNLAGDPAGFLVDAVRDFPEIRGRVQRGELERPIMVTGPFDRAVRQVWVPGALLVGDAAGYFDPFTGQGVYQALRTARLAADAIETALREPDAEASALSAYGWRARSEFGPKRWVQRLIDAAIHRPALMSRFVGALSAGDGATGRRLLHVTGDVTGPLALLDPRFLSRLTLSLAWRA